MILVYLFCLFALRIPGKLFQRKLLALYTPWCYLIYPTLNFTTRTLILFLYKYSGKILILNILSNMVFEKIPSYFAPPNVVRLIPESYSIFDTFYIIILLIINTLLRNASIHLIFSYCFVAWISLWFSHFDWVSLPL